MWHIKIASTNQEKWPGHNSLLKWFEDIFITLPMITGTGTKYVTM